MASASSKLKPRWRPLRGTVFDSSTSPARLKHAAMAAASGDGEAETLLSTFDQIYDDFERGAAEIQSLRLSCDAEVKRREALEIACDGLRRGSFSSRVWQS